MEANPGTRSQDLCWRAYVGCRTTLERHGRGRAIEAYECRPGGAWKHLHSTPAGDNPSFLAIDPSGRCLHAVHGDGVSLTSFAIGADGGLRPLGSCSVQGRNPVHLCFSPCARWVLIANYASGSVVSLPVQADGGLGPVASRLQLPDAPGPHRSQQRGAHPHQVVFDPSGQWLLVPDKGADAIHTLRLDAGTGALYAAHCLPTAPGSGPRHLVFDAAGRHAWAVLELSSQILSMRFDAATGKLQPLQRTSSVPDSFTGANTGAGILLSPQGDALCVSNRGHGSLCIHAVDPATGWLDRPRWMPAGGGTPRFICHAPGPVAWSVLAANEDAHCITGAAIGPVGAAALVPAFPLAHTGSPVCIVFTQGFP